MNAHLDRQIQPIGVTITWTPIAAHAKQFESSERLERNHSMYLQGVVTIDPSQLTHLDRVKPTKGFARMAHLLTGGLVASEKNEKPSRGHHIAANQRCHAIIGCRQCCPTCQGRHSLLRRHTWARGGFKTSIDAFSAKAKSDDISLFNTLDLVLEHHTEKMAFLIDIRIHRTTALGSTQFRSRSMGFRRN